MPPLLAASPLPLVADLTSPPIPRFRSLFRTPTRACPRPDTRKLGLYSQTARSRASSRTSRRTLTSRRTSETFPRPCTTPCVACTPVSHLARVTHSGVLAALIQNNGAAAAAAAAAAAPLPGPQPHINNFPSVLSQAPPAPQFAPAPGIPVNMAPQNMPALPQPLNPDGSQPPPKRPRGRPRKVPGTENRSTPAAGAAGGAGAGADASGRGRPKARGRGRGRGGRGRGRGGKRARVSSDEEDYGPDLASSSDAEGEEDDAEKSVDLNQEVDDDVRVHRSLRLFGPRPFLLSDRLTMPQTRSLAARSARRPSLGARSPSQSRSCRPTSPRVRPSVLCSLAP